jgi:hypothetical protein
MSSATVLAGAVPVPESLTKGGSCHWNFFFTKMAAQAGFHGSISLHMEYEIPGVSGCEGVALSRTKDSEGMDVAKQNLDTLKSLIHRTHGA